ncbi:hypothetical protein TrST_g4676 [Triparma strigata]|uniref:Neurotransmitter-gated ion-channel ligand-binding domain-containing protein n=1 Tax=Triparma strigata TaxID=1606541 RepID=A0A9W6ZQP2_9STRA|nr:hypothetical protein TrST_g4676 [Triparma strigata]
MHVQLLLLFCLLLISILLINSQECPCSSSVPPCSPIVGLTFVNKNLLENYDTTVPPLPDGGGPVEVSFTLNVYKITDLSIKDANVDFNTWITLYWYDSRLSWDPDCYGGVNRTRLYSSSDTEQTSIWVPDITLYNQNGEGLEAWGEKQSVVTSAGLVKWKRQGTLRSLATFSGMSAFPFDKLQMTLRFGSWSLTTDILEVTLEDGLEFSAPGISFGVSDDVNDLQSTRSTGYLDGFSFEITLQRAVSFYWTKAIIPNIILTYLSFGSLLTDVRAGERLSYSATLVLASVALDLTMGEYIPICPEWLWLQTLIFVSLIFSSTTIFISLYVIWLYFLDRGEEEDLTDDIHTPLYNLRRAGSLKLVKMFSKRNVNNPDPSENELELSSSIKVDKTADAFYDAQSPEQETTQSVHLKIRTLNRRNVERGQRIDALWFNLLVSFYTLFLIIMFATIGLWRSIGGGQVEIGTGASLV